jgi:uncharacterized protein (TIGR03083 family)
MDVPSLITALRAQGPLLAAAASATELTTPVPTCPGWAVRDLLLHVGGVHRWAATVVGQALTTPVDIDQPYDVVDRLPDDDGLLDWFRDGHAALVDTLERAPSDVTCWTFLPGASPLAMWARRQTHETTVHRVDAELAAVGTATAVRPDVARDGIDELLTCFVSRRNRRLRAKAERTLHVHATDVDAHWRVRIGRDGPVTERVMGLTRADDVVSGPATALYLALWNRTPWDDLTVTGRSTRAGLAELWSTAVYVRWS